MIKFTITTDSGSFIVHLVMSEWVMNNDNDNNNDINIFNIIMENTNRSTKVKFKLKSMINKWYFTQCQVRVDYIASIQFRDGIWPSVSKI